MSAPLEQVAPQQVDPQQVDPQQWRAAIAATIEQGFGFLHSIGAVDDLGRADTITVTIRLLRFSDDLSGAAPQVACVQCAVPRDGGSLPDISDHLSGAAWYQREVHDMFGVQFDGADVAPLLHHDHTIQPLRKDFVLAPRAVVAWPGAKEPGESPRGGAPSRRRMAPAGVPDPQVWGEQRLGDPAPNPDDLAAALAGGRVRRRR